LSKDHDSTIVGVVGLNWNPIQTAGTKGYPVVAMGRFAAIPLTGPNAPRRQRNPTTS